MNNNFEIMRATEEWQRAGAYSVRIQGMNRQYNIPLREEFDEYDRDGTNYIVILDKGYPIATCRFYEISKETITIGRVVVLPEYRGQRIGSLVINEAEKWIKELGYKAIEIYSRVEVVDFYLKLGYQLSNTSDEVTHNGVFDCIKMSKLLIRGNSD